VLRRFSATVPRLNGVARPPLRMGLSTLRLGTTAADRLSRPSGYSLAERGDKRLCSRSPWPQGLRQRLAITSFREAL
jgi:hypothetical protein